MAMCFPSIAPRQFGKFHLALKPSATLFHFSGVLGVCKNKETNVNSVVLLMYIIYVKSFYILSSVG